MSKKIFIWLLATILLTTVSLAEAQQQRVYNVGVLTLGGPDRPAIKGLRGGLRESDCHPQELLHITQPPQKLVLPQGTSARCDRACTDRIHDKSLDIHHGST